VAYYRNRQWRTGLLDGVQGITITDPHLVAEILQSKEFDKDGRTYRTLDSVRLSPYCFHGAALAIFIPSYVHLALCPECKQAHMGARSYSSLLEIVKRCMVPWDEISNHSNSKLDCRCLATRGTGAFLQHLHHLLDGRVSARESCLPSALKTSGMPQHAACMAYMSQRGTLLAKPAQPAFLPLTANKCRAFEGSQCK